MNEINLQEVANNLTNMVCEEHRKGIYAQVIGDKIEFRNPCCESFGKRVQDEYGRQLNAQVLKGMNDMFKNL